MRMLDLFCGRWGWSRAFAARGWECTGVDLIEPPEIPEGCKFIKMDVLLLDPDYWADMPDFICASPPCEQFSTMRNFRPPVPYPELGIKLFDHARSICQESGVPYIMENVIWSGQVCRSLCEPLRPILFVGKWRASDFASRNQQGNDRTSYGPARA